MTVLRGDLCCLRRSLFAHAADGPVSAIGAHSYIDARRRAGVNTCAPPFRSRDMLPPAPRLAAVIYPTVVPSLARLVVISVLGLALVPFAAGPTAAAQSPDAHVTSSASPITATETVSDSAGMLLPYESVCTERTGIQATMILPADADLSVQGRPLVPGDQVAVFSENGVCAGFITWTGDNAALTIWGDDYLSAEIDGLLGGDPMHVRVRTAGGTEHSARNSRVTLTFRDDADHLTSAPTFTPNGIYVVKTLSIDSVEHANGAE